MKNINIYYLNIYQELNQSIIEIISLFLVKPNYIEEIDYTLIFISNQNHENHQNKNIKINKEYFIQLNNLNDLIHIFYMRTIHQINHK